MRARNVVRHRQRLRTAIRVRTDRVGEQRLAGSKTAFNQVVLSDRLHCHDGCRLRCNLHGSRRKRRRGGCLAFVATSASVVDCRHGHLHRLKIRRLVAVEVGGSSRGQDDLPTAQREVRGMRSGDIVRNHRRDDAAVGVRTDGVTEQRLAR